MKKIVVATVFALMSSAFAFDDFETFRLKIMRAFEGVPCVAYEFYVEWNGDAEACIKYFQENGQCYGE